MPEYPLERVCKEEWTRKINSTYMFSSIAEEEGIPILQELIEIMQRLNTLPIEQTLVGEAVEYFFTQVFPQVSQKILSSKYFKYLLSHAEAISSWPTPTRSCWKVSYCT